MEMADLCCLYRRLTLKIMSSEPVGFPAIRKIGHTASQSCFSTDQISFSYFCRRSSSDHFY